MVNLFKSKVDKLVGEYNKNVIKRQSVVDKENVELSNIENQIHALEYKSWLVKMTAEKKLADYDRLIAKISRDIKSEKDYVNSVQVSTDKK